MKSPVSHGSPLLGWSDPYNAATWPIEHLKQLQQESSTGSVSDFFSLYMVPGTSTLNSTNSSRPLIVVTHLFRWWPLRRRETYPSVPATYHVEEVLIAWVEDGVYPDSILSSNPPDGSARTRKLCPWPETARLRPSLRPDEAQSYYCTRD